jgi:hypothetical protein
LGELQDTAEYWSNKRKEYRKDNFDLLWENIEKGRFAQFVHNGKMSDSEKCELQVNFQNSTLSDIYITLNQSCIGVKNTDLHPILQYGAARRYGGLRLGVNTIMRIAPPNRRDTLSLDEAQSVSSALMLIYVHLVGILDAFAIAFMRLKEISGDEKKADLLKKSFRSKLKSDRLDDIFQCNDDWLRRIKEKLRNRFVHRIPPYVPHAAMTASEIEEMYNLEVEKFKMLRAGDLSGSEEIEERQKKLGQFRPVLVFSESDEQMLLHPTVLDDVFRLNVMVMDMLDELLLSQQA